MSPQLPDNAHQGPRPESGIILYQTEDGRTRVECRFEAETLWLTQALMGELFQKDVRTINEHLLNIFEEGELDAGATIRKFRIVRAEGSREVAREIEHYSLPAILAVGYRVRSHRGTQFRQWATARLTEFLVKGFTMDDERLKNPAGKGQKDYFDDLLERRITNIGRVSWYLHFGPSGAAGCSNGWSESSSATRWERRFELTRPGWGDGGLGLQTCATTAPASGKRTVAESTRKQSIHQEAPG